MLTRSRATLAGIAALLLFADAVSAQLQSAIVPKAYEKNGTSLTQRPLALQPGRYQQLYEAKALQQDILTPVRIKGVRFRAKQTGNLGANVDLQLTIGTYGLSWSTTFDNNLKDATVVFRGTITLPTSTAGQWVVNLPFTQDFTWDRESNIALDIAVFQNGANSQPFLYWFDSFVADFAAGVDAHWAIGPTARTSTWQGRGTGLVTQFDFAEGVALNYGQGCQGEGGFVPKISTNGVPVLGNTQLRVNLTLARPQTPCALLWGGSNKQWGPFQLPLDLKGVGIPGCTLYAEPLLVFPAMSLGGSPGSGIASVPFGIPAVTTFKGITLFAQWAVVDDTVKVRALPYALSDAILLAIG